MACRCERGLPSANLKPSSSAVVSIAASLLASLGASSCCVVQLAFNAVGLGCAGFAVLTPYEGVFKGITLAALAHLLLRDGLNNRRALLTTALSLSLMFSQDAVRFYNQGGPAPLGGLLHSLLSRPPAPTQPPTANSQHSDDMLDTRRQGDQRTCDQGHPAAASTGAAGPAVQQACRSEMCSSTSQPGGTISRSKEQHEGDEYEYGDDDEPEQAQAQAHTAVADAETGVDAAAEAAPPGDGELYLRLRVEGIKCEGCAARLRAAVLRLPGVRRCVVDFAGKAVLLWGAAGELGEQGAAVRTAIQHMDLSYRVALEESRQM